MFAMDETPADPLDAQFEAKCQVTEAPGIPKAWCVTDLKNWVMDEIGSGTIEDCRDALVTFMAEAEAPKKGKTGKRDRPFFYVTVMGEPPEMESEPFTSMTFTAFPAYCDSSSVAQLATLEGLRALEIRRTKTMPHGYRVRIFHSAETVMNLETMSEMLDFQALYNMGFDLNPRPNTGGGASIAFTPDEHQQMRAAEASAKFAEEATQELAETLKEENTELLKRAVSYAGMKFCKQILKQTLEVEEQGGMMTQSGTRRRTPGGVFCQLLKKEITDAGLLAVIFDEPLPVVDELAANAIPIASSAGSTLRVDAVAFTPDGTSPLGSSLDAKAQEFTPPSRTPQ